MIVVDIDDDDDEDDDDDDDDVVGVVVVVVVVFMIGGSSIPLLHSRTMIDQHTPHTRTHTKDAISRRGRIQPSGRCSQGSDVLHRNTQMKR